MALIGRRFNLSVISSKLGTYIAPASDLVKQIITSETEVHDALVDGAAGPLRG